MERENRDRFKNPATQASPDSAFELAHAGMLQRFPELVAELGGDPDAFMKYAGLEPAVLHRYASRLSYRSMIGLLEYAAIRLHRPDFGMRLAALQGGWKVFGPIGVVMRNSNTFGDALRYVMKHIHAHIPAASVWIEPERTGQKIFAGFDILLDHLPHRSQAIEQVMLLGHLNALEITNGRVRAREVHFRHRPVSPLSTYRDYFGCEVRFDRPAAGVLFTQDDLNAPIADPETEHYEMAAFFIDSKFPVAVTPLHARVRGSIMRHLGVSECSIERIAEELCVHPRTLHRHLKWEGKSFEDIKDEVRRDAAQYYLERTDVPLTRISEKLGYSETSVLSRSCLRWFGSSPSELRARPLGESESDAPPLVHSRGLEASARIPAPAGKAVARQRSRADAPAAMAMVRIDTLRNFDTVVSRLGGNPKTLLSKAGIDAESLSNRDAVILHLSLVKLLKQSAIDLSCPDFGMRLAAAQDVTKVLGPLEVAMRNSATLRAAFAYCASNMQVCSLAARISIENNFEKEFALLQLDVKLPGFSLDAQAVEHALLLTQQNIVELSGGQSRAREIRFTHEPISPVATYRNYFGATVKFGQTANGALLPNGDLDSIIPGADPQLYGLATYFIDTRHPAHESDLGARVRALIERRLQEGQCTQDDVAAKLGIGARVLQRRLREEGRSFESIRDTARRDLAFRHLTQSDLPLIRVAELLGYSDTAVLAKSCYRWFSASPRRLRMEGNARGAPEASPPTAPQ
jgi:AraC-like DNA-binding protein